MILPFLSLLSSSPLTSSHSLSLVPLSPSLLFSLSLLLSLSLLPSQNTGLFVFLMIFSSCLCCGAYVVLCCEGRFHRYIKYCGLCGFCYVSCSFALLVMWVILGTYLLGLMRADAVAESVCRNVSIYVTFIYAYIVVFVIVCIIAIIWKLHEVATSLQSKSRTRSK